jgi:hypothetical protein
VMQLVRLTVERFGTIGRADLELGPGLNILYGPNELGKSSLCDAIRLALLLPHTSNASEPFVSWSAAQAPKVTLVYRTREELHRVTKVFDSTRGSSLLESSSDGEVWSTVARAREVDERIRQHLSWGIPAPGKGAPKGLPESFLTTALLSRQGEVDAILAGSLVNDPDDSGKQRISKALQALAEDPLFKKILARTQTRVDEAYRQDGKPRGGKGAPFTQTAETVAKARQEVQTRREDVEEARHIAERVRTHAEARQKKEVERDAQAATLRSLEEALAAASARAVAEKALGKARAELARIDTLAKLVASLGVQVDDGVAALAKLDATVAAHTAALEAARTGLEAARTRAAELSSAEGAQRVAAQRSELARRKLEIEARAGEARRLKASAETVRALDGKLTAVVKEAKGRREALAAAQKLLGNLKVTDKELDAEAEVTRALSLYATWKEAAAAAKKAQDDAALVARLKGEASEKRGEAAALGETAARGLPAPSLIATLRQLERDRDVAESALKVGLSVEIAPEKKLSVEVASDGGKAQTEQVDKPATFTADRELSLRFAGVAITVSGGAAKSKEKLRKLRARWKSEAEPVLEAAGVADLSELEAAVAATGKSEQKAAHLRSEAAALEGRCRDLGDVTTALAQATKRLADAEGPLAGHDRDRLAARAAALPGPLAAQVDKLSRALDVKRRELADKRRAQEVIIGREQAFVESSAKEEETRRAELTAAAGALGGAWDTVLAAAQAKLATAETELAVVVGELAALEDRASSAVTQAASVVGKAEAALAKCTKELAAATKDRDAAREALATLRGRLVAERDRAGETDRGAALALVTEAEAAVAATPAPPKPVTEVQVSAARASLERLSAEVRQLETELHKEEGALSLVGGMVAEERLADAQAALEQARRAEAEVEADYQAWQLLLTTLHDAEQAQATHLGKTLLTPVAERFRSLTGGRYESLAMGSQLETEGVVQGGQTRGQDRLSVGTREQLATIFRLALAQQLKSALVLDDQLVQSDLQRMAWFSTVLREAASGIQILVITCRPEDYLGDRPALGSPPSVEVGGVRVVDLARLVTRG